MTDLALRSQADVFRLPLPGKGEAVYFDEGQPKDRAPGLGLRIREAGSRKFVFFFRHGGRQLKMTIGDASSWTLDKARIAARDLRVQVEKGNNPATDKAVKRTASALMFSTVKDEYLAARRPTMKPRTYKEYERYLFKHWKSLHGMPAGSVDRATVAAILRKIAQGSGPVSADRARSALLAMFSWAIGEGLCNTNPVDGTNTASEAKPRERVMSDAELGAIWNAASDDSYGSIVKLLMLTAQRREEIGGMRWSEIAGIGNAAVISLPAQRTKNSRPHIVPLSAAAREVLASVPEVADRDFVFGNGAAGFSAWSRSKDLLGEKLGKTVAPWTLHDLRRTAATRMADSGVQPHIIEAVLNHVSGHKSGVAGVYNRATYEPEKRAALDTLANYIKTAVAKSTGANVSRLRAKGG